MWKYKHVYDNQTFMLWETNKYHESLVELVQQRTQLKNFAFSADNLVTIETAAVTLSQSNCGTKASNIQQPNGAAF